MTRCVEELVYEGSYRVRYGYRRVLMKEVSGAGYTEVRLDGWREGGLGQQRYASGISHDNERKITRSGEPRCICR